jgi:hypothetical protein
MKMYGRVEVQVHIYLTSALGESEWATSCPGRFSPWEIAPIPIRYEAVCDAAEKRKSASFTTNRIQISQLGSP